jgi:ABC-type dipeptide/oligopeptide/nickel transport system permease component
MSLSIVVASASSASASSVVSSAISMTSITGLAVGGVLATILLILLLSLQEILSASNYWNKNVLNAFNTATLPLIFVFVATVLFKVLEIL